jgi:hypothetical protein
MMMWHFSRIRKIRWGGTGFPIFRGVKIGKKAGIFAQEYKK